MSAPVHGATPVRAEIQGLRAVAVLLVLVYHLWPLRLPGGYVGVDVFFVISGFLITGHLVREYQRDGRIRLAGFWARRARRLLPASLLVLVVTGIATALLVPQTLWGRFFSEIAASTLYVQNWVLAANSIDYLAADNSASPVQHYWSLSVEEQFYLVWPLIILVVYILTRRFGASTPSAQKRTLAIVLGVIAAASLVFSIVETVRSPASAYFITPTRGWEFAAGGILAVLGTAPAASLVRLRAALGWLGFALMAIAALAFTNATPFPGYAAALPVAGALLVIWAGEPEVPWAATGLLRTRLVQWIGDGSYSTYLWHWPFVVILPIVLGAELTTVQKVLVLVGALLLGWLSKRFVEDPVRTAPLLARHRPRRTFAFAVAAMAVAILVTVVPVVSLQGKLAAEVQAAENAVGSTAPCFGAAAAGDSGCAPDMPGETIVPTTLAADEDTNGPCDIVNVQGSGIHLCEFGASAEDATATVVVAGDSHAMHVRPALLEVAKERGWRVLSMAESGCPATLAVKILPEPDKSACIEYNKAAIRWWQQQDDIDYLFVGSLAGNSFDAVDGLNAAETGTAGYQEYWSQLPKSIKHIFVVRDNPRANKDVHTCVDASTTARFADCAVERKSAVKHDPAAEAAETWPAGNATVLDFTDLYCDDTLCYPVVGGVLIPRDWNHVTSVWASTMAPFYEEKISAAIGAP